jgi:hypothetical protein
MWEEGPPPEEGTPAFEAFQNAFGEAATTEENPPEEGLPVEPEPGFEVVEGQEQAAAEEGTAEPEEPLIGGKFKSTEDLLEAYEHVEAYAGRMAWERDQALREAQTVQQAPPQQTSEPDWDSLIEDRPAVAAQHALQTGNQHRLTQALQAWNEVSPGAPELWLENKRMQAELQEVRTIAQAGSETSRGFRTREEVAAAYNEMVQRYPDFENLRDGLAKEVALLAQGGNPGIANMLENGTHEQRIRILDQLYHAARSRSIKDMDQVARRAAQVHAEETAKAKAGAMVTSATTGGKAGSSSAELLGQQWENLLAPLQDDWLVQSE